MEQGPEPTHILQGTPGGAVCFAASLSHCPCHPEAGMPSSSAQSHGGWCRLCGAAPPEDGCRGGQHACCSCCFRRLLSGAWFKANTSSYRIMYQSRCSHVKSRACVLGRMQLYAGQSRLSPGVQAHREPSAVPPAGCAVSCLDTCSLWMFI